MKRQIEINTYEKDGIKITVKIDYINEKISLVEFYRESGFHKNKDFCFASRGLPYMKSWQKILDAMKHAIEEGTKLLEISREEKDKIEQENIKKAIEYVAAQKIETYMSNG